MSVGMLKFMFGLMTPFEACPVNITDMENKKNKMSTNSSSYRSRELYAWESRKCRLYG